MRGLRRRAASRHARPARSPTTTSTRCGTAWTTTRRSSTTSARKLNYTLNSAHKFQYLIQGDDKIQDSRGASATTAKEATNRQFSDYWHGIPAADALADAHLHRQRQAGVQHASTPTSTAAGPTTSRTTTPAARSATTAATSSADYARDAELPVEPAAALAADDRLPEPLAARVDPAPAADARTEDRRRPTSCRTSSAAITR